MTRSAILATAIGLVLAATLLASNDIGAILSALRMVGWSIVPVVLLHLPQTFFSAIGWGVLIGGPVGGGARAPASAGPVRGTGWRRLYLLRWIRESVNALLPVAQLGGDFVRARLLAQRGGTLSAAVASTMVDLSLEGAAQLVFTLLGLGLLLAGPYAGAAVPVAIGAAVASCAIVIGFVAAQRLGMFKYVERLVARWSRRKHGPGDLTGLNDAVLAAYRRPRRLAASTALHLASWLFGSVETYAAMRALGLDTGLREATIIEGLGQAVRGLAFLVPGALGVQEGGYLLICGMFGIAAHRALALSLIRRLRELALGLPGLILWQRLEARRPAAPDAPRAAAA